MIVVKNIKKTRVYSQRVSVSKKASKLTESLLARKIEKLLLSNNYTCDVNVK